MEARLTALEIRLRQAERALVVERLARQTAEEIGTLPIVSGDIDLSGLVKLKKYVGWWEAGHNERECPEKKRDQHRTGQCAGVKEDHEASTAEPSGSRGTGVLSPAAEQNACLLHEDDSDQSMFSCASPT